MTQQKAQNVPKFVVIQLTTTTKTIVMMETQETMTVVQVLAELRQDSNVITLQLTLKTFVLKFAEINMTSKDTNAKMETTMIMMVVHQTVKLMMVGTVSEVPEPTLILATKSAEMEETTNTRLIMISATMVTMKTTMVAHPPALLRMDMNALTETMIQLTTAMKLVEMVLDSTQTPHIAMIMTLLLVMAAMKTALLRKDSTVLEVAQQLTMCATKIVVMQ